jgi:hypothetical protein
MNKFYTVIFSLFFVFNAKSQCTTTNATSCQCADGTQNCLLLPDITASWKGIINNGWIEYPQSGAGTNYTGQGPDDGRIRVTGSTPNIGHGSFTVRGQDANGKRAFICGNDTVFNVPSTGTFTCPNGAQNPNQLLVQRVYKKDLGVMSYVDTWTGSMTYHPSHGHNHVNDWAVMTLRIQTNDPSPLNWPIVGHGAKIGFCLMDYGQCGTAGSTYDGHCRDDNTVYLGGNTMLNASFPNWNLGGGNYNCSVVEQGISSGWTDVYGKHLDGMWINVPSNTCNGNYYIVMEVDKNNNFQEENENNNYTAVPVTLTMQHPANSNHLPTITSDASSNLCTGGSINLSATGGSNFLWSTGATTQSITVTQAGAYTCTVTNYCGVSTSLPYLVSSVAPSMPSAQGLTICANQVANLSAIGTGQLTWYDAQGIQVAAGPTYTTPVLTNSIGYFVSNTQAYSDSVYVEPHTNGIGGGGYSSTSQYEIFNSYETFTLKSAKVYAVNAGNISIELQASDATVLQSTTVSVPSGASRITLNFAVPLDSNLRLRVTSVPTGGLYRNNNSAIYPYEIPGLVSITGCSAGASYYCYLYDWEIFTPNGTCESALTPVNIVVNGPMNLTVLGDTICDAGTLVLSASGMGTINWYDSNGALVGTGNTFATPVLTSSQVYYAQSVIDSCASEMIPVDAVVLPCAGIVDPLVFMNSFSIFPNPNNGHFQLKLNPFLKGNVSYSITDINGKLLYRESINEIYGQSLVDVNASYLSKGLYLVNLTFDNNTYTKRVSIE